MCKVLSRLNIVTKTALVLA